MLDDGGMEMNHKGKGDLLFTLQSASGTHLGISQ